MAILPVATLPHLSGVRYRAAASCQTRVRFLVCCFDLLERFDSAVQRFALDDGRWQGQRTFWGGGSGGAMPDITALQEAFGQPAEPRPGCGVPVTRLQGLFHAGTSLLLKRVVAPLPKTVPGVLQE